MKDQMSHSDLTHFPMLSRCAHFPTFIPANGPTDETLIRVELWDHMSDNLDSTTAKR